jgi:transposase-like protein
MSRPMESPKRRPRRQFTEEFRDGVVRLVLDDGKTVGAVARDMETAVREWVKRARVDQIANFLKVCSPWQASRQRMRPEMGTASLGSPQA